MCIRDRSVDEGSTVQVTVSRGNQFTMPDLRGQTPEQARSTLQSRGWSDSTLTQSTKGVPLGSPDIGKIIDQQPAAGSQLSRNDAVTVTVGQLSLLPN